MSRTEFLRFLENRNAQGKLFMQNFRVVQKKLLLNQHALFNRHVLAPVYRQSFWFQRNWFDECD